MILKLFAVRDSAAQAFTAPIGFPTTGLAIRSFQERVNDPQGDLFKHASDYELFELGEYDDSTASFVIHPDPISMVRAVDLKEKQAA